MSLEQQARETTDTYFDVQHRMLDGYQKTMQCLQPWTGNSTLWERWQHLNERRLQLWEAQAKSLMDAHVKMMLTGQSLWTRYWLNILNPLNALSTLTNHGVRQVQQVMEDSAKAYGRATEGSLEAGKDFDMKNVAEIWNETLQNATDSLEESYRKITENQQVMLRKLEETNNRICVEEEQAS